MVTKRKKRKKREKKVSAIEVDGVRKGDVKETEMKRWLLYCCMTETLSNFLDFFLTVI